MKKFTKDLLSDKKSPTQKPDVGFSFLIIHYSLNQGSPK